MLSHSATGNLLHKELSDQVIGAAIEIHRQLGPGLLESAYQACLAHELSLRGILFVSQLDLPLTYKGVQLDVGYRIDLLIDDKVIVELKAVEKVLPIHEAQLLTYLRLLRKPVGLLLSFFVPVLKDGIIRRVL
ncbi:MAG: GxxExxY protein [Planctomycetes bacterium]|nr:GxxExxY protein [Planctomycetota bacterium]MCH8260586.1 GxxExxY protein [Planctomycetota bacterium]